MEKNQEIIINEEYKKFLLEWNFECENDFFSKPNITKLTDLQKDNIKIVIEELENNIINFISSYKEISKPIYEILFDREQYELKITKIGKKIEFNDDFTSEILSDYIIVKTNYYILKNKNITSIEINSTYTENRLQNNPEYELNKLKLLELISTFLAIESKFRKNKNYDQLKDLKDNFRRTIDNLQCFKTIKAFIKYLEILSDYASTSDAKDYKHTFNEIKKYFDKKIVDNDDHTKIIVNYFNKNAGVINLYSEAIANYYEYFLDKKDDSIEDIDDGIKKIKEVIDSKELNNEKVYHKFYLTLGRLYSLKGKNEEAIKEIHKALNSIPDDSKKESLISEYQQYILLNKTIRSFDISNSKLKEMDKIKIDNVKALSILTGFLGFILGEITLFTKSDDVGVLCKMMVLYAFVILGLLGVSLTGIDIILPGKKTKREIVFLIFSAILTIISISVIAVLYFKWK